MKKSQKQGTARGKQTAGADAANPAVPPDPDVIDVATTGTRKQSRINSAGRKKT